MLLGELLAQPRAEEATGVVNPLAGNEHTHADGVDARANEDEFRCRALELSDGEPEGVAYADDACARSLCVGVVGRAPPAGG